ncbi:MAG: alpha-ketoacid dehydrogenase subunit beta [Alphaproteobacteria bacterium]|nr:alpha-ketoacid dehydrogenase subunit beta [Alphaproteobacteria bacterium]
MPERIINLAEALRECLAESAARDSNVLVLAEGAEDPVPMFGTLRDVGERATAEQVIEMPVAENGLVGVAIGAAMMGKRPVVSFQRVEFALLAFEQIVNNAAKAHYISNGEHKVPLVVRLVVGRGWGQGPEHSQSLESVFAAFPGLKVIMPAFPADGKGMLAAAIEDDNPVIVIEHRWCHYTTGDVPAGYYTESLDGPRRIREGSDVTIVATSYMVLEAMRAADALAAAGVQAEVYDLRVVRPLNLSAIEESVARTGRLLTVDTGHHMFGVGAEIVAQIAQRRFGDLTAPPRRLGLPDHPTPSSRGLVPGFYPDAARIAEEVGDMLAIPVDKVAGVVDDLRRLRGDLPIDVPDPFFKGPF